MLVDTSNGAERRVPIDDSESSCRLHVPDPQRFVGRAGDDTAIGQHRQRIHPALVANDRGND
jgi:hypothetical protein